MPGIQKDRFGKSNGYANQYGPDGNFLIITESYTIEGTIT